MFTERKSIYVGNEKVLVQATCMESDTKPTDGIANGSLCLEMDTGKWYGFDEDSSDWVEIGA